MQIAELGHQSDALYLSLPASYIVTTADQQRLDLAGVTPLKVPDGLRLGESLLYALTIIGDHHDPVHILHGDTLIYDQPLEQTDVLAVGRVTDAYQWGILENQAREFSIFDASGLPQAIEVGSVLSGYFSFSNGTELRRSLARSQGDFLAAISDYNRSIELKLWYVKDWLDFGHLQTFYRSRCRIRTQRAFNELEVSFRMVEKRSTNFSKIDAEAHWFETLPPPLRAYTPAFLGKGMPKPSYRLEYLPLPSLHELFVFGHISEKIWLMILESCFAFMRDCITVGQEVALDGVLNKPIINQLTFEKTNERLAEFERAMGYHGDEEWRYKGQRAPSLRRIAEFATEMIDQRTTSFLGVMHGDLCCTNIFFDFRTQRIKIIDPRGTVDNESPTIFGDSRYDMAKLAHSLIGGYDFILSDRAVWSGFDCRDIKIDFPIGSAIDTVAKVTNEYDLLGLRLSDPQVRGIMIHLFMSMLPLHADRPDRQQAFVANAIRLFTIGER